MSPPSAPRVRSAARIVPLDRGEAVRRVERLCEIDRGTMGEPWTATHWLYDAPDKWRLSRMALCDAVPCGVIVASRKPGTVHIHRVAVDVAMRGHGLGTLLVGEVAALAQAEGVPALSLKVHAHNQPARGLYEALGFTVVESAGAQLTMRAAPAAVVAAVADRSRRRTS